MPSGQSRPALRRTFRAGGPDPFRPVAKGERVKGANLEEPSRFPVGNRHLRIRPDGDTIRSGSGSRQ